MIKLAFPPEVTFLCFVKEALSKKDEQGRGLTLNGAKSLCLHGGFQINHGKTGAYFS